mmetsp:Transcript_5911/g.9621  ORF Transcript_5911/g.9621 Transcript_5911/m.9621 type:complete len:260 (+) Transcript_5911:2849-3628(+)
MSIKEIEGWNRAVDSSFIYNYKDMTTHPFFVELYPNLQKKLISLLLKDEVYFFIYLFGGFTRSGIQNKVADTLIYEMLANVECEQLPPSKIIVRNLSELTHFYMIKQGTVKCFDKKYNYLMNLEPGSFFGEYNILFGLYSQMYYQTHSADNHDTKKLSCLLFKIEAKKFMQIVLRDSTTFKHLHHIALKKFKFNQALIQKVEEIEDRMNTRIKAARKPQPQKQLRKKSRFSLLQPNHQPTSDTLQPPKKGPLVTAPSGS